MTNTCYICGVTDESGFSNWGQSPDYGFYHLRCAQEVRLREAQVTNDPTFVCPICGAISHNPNDIANRYCGKCHRFVDDPKTISEEKL